MSGSGALRTLGMVRVKKQPANAPGKAPAIWPSCSRKSTPSLKTFGISERKDQRHTGATAPARGADDQRNQRQ
jgi:hypothetical protein